MDDSDSRSDEQVRAQNVALAMLKETLGLSLAPRRFYFDSGAYTDIDGFHEDDRQVVAVEVWAHVGKAKGGQPHKVAKDVLKLASVASAVRKREPKRSTRLLLVFINQEARRTVTGKSWLATAAHELGVESMLVDVGDGLVKEVEKAQARQFR
jgi:hypothetical protein